MKRYFLFSFLIICFHFSSIAQILSGQQFSAYFPNKLLAISQKIVKYVKSENSEIFKEQELTNKFRMDTIMKYISINQFHLPITEVPGGSVYIVQLQNWRYPDDPSDLVDSMFFVPVNEDSLAPELLMNFSLNQTSNHEHVYALRAVAPVYNRTENNSNTLKAPFWIDNALLKQILSAEEYVFLLNYTILKMRENRYQSNNESTIQTQQQTTFGCQLMAQKHGEMMWEDLKKIIFLKFKNNELALLDSNNKSVDYNQFSKVHYTVEIQESWDALTEKVTLDEIKIPLFHFNQIEFQIINSQINVVIFQHDSISQSKIRKYQLAFEKLKPHLHPFYYDLITAAILQN